MTEFVDVPISPLTPGYDASTSPDIKLAVIANIWIKMMYFKKVGDFIPGRRHLFDHGTLVSYGSVEVEIENNKTTFTAPAIIYIEAGKTHRITALEANTVISCIHGLRNDENREELISPDMVPRGVDPRILPRVAPL